MIDAKELRIGNWIIIDNGDKPKYNYEVTSHDIEEIEGFGEDCFPIPLSSELLEKCGFEVTSKGFYTHSSWYNLSLKYRVNTYDVRCNFMERIATNMNYLHQLQNFFYACVGVELKIDL